MTCMFRGSYSFLSLGCILRHAADIIREGGLVVFPTSTIYGLAGDATRADVVETVFSVKNRSTDKAISVIVSDIVDLNRVTKSVSHHSMILMNKFWPGGVTFVLEASDTLPDVLTAGTGKIGVRIPSNRFARALVKVCGIPITATSANVSGDPGAVCIKEIGSQLLSSADLIIDVGPLRGGIGSTIVDITVDPPLILREGVVSKLKFI